MDEAQFHRRLQALRDLDSHLEGSDFWNHSAFLHEVVERTAPDEFHGDVKLGTGFAEIKNSNHIRVVDLSSRARLVSQLLRFVMLVAALNLQHLQGDLAIKRKVQRTERGAHPPLAQE